jgi:glutaminase
VSVVAATLANGGVNPISRNRCAQTDHVRCALPLMMNAGMYDYSGQASRPSITH